MANIVQSGGLNGDNEQRRQYDIQISDFVSIIMPTFYRDPQFKSR